MGRWEGRVVGQGECLGWSSLDAHGEVRAHWTSRATFMLELADGHRIEVVCSDRQLKVEPIKERRERWGDLETLPESIGFRARGPAPHSKVTLRSASIRDGDEVTVFGEVLESGFEEGSDHRTAPTPRPSQVSAQRVVLGAAPEEEASPSSAPRPPEPRTSPRPPVLAMLGYAGALMSFVGAWLSFDDAAPLSPRVPDFVLYGVGLIGVALVWHFHSSHPIGFFHRDARVSGRVPSPLLLATMGMYLFLGASLVSWDGTSPEGTVVNNQRFLFGLTMMVQAFGLFALLFATLRTLRLARIVLGASPSHFAPGTWGQVVGIVHDPTPVLGDAAMAAQTEVENDDSGDIDLELTIFNDDSFTVRSGEVDVEVMAAEGVWATSIRRFGGGWEAVRTVGAAGSGRTRTLVSTELIPQGASIVVVGRLKGARRLVLESTGPESLVFFAAPHDVDPVAALRRLVRRRIALLLSVAALAALGCGIVLATQDRLPPSHSYLPDSN